MSITFNADIDSSILPTKQVRLVDQYPGLDNSDFARDDYKTDAEGFYIETVIDSPVQFERNFSNENFYAVMNTISPALARVTEQNGGMWMLDSAEVHPFLALVIKARNSAKLDKHVRESVQVGNWHFGGIDRDYLERGLNDIMEICQTAIKEGKGVNWA